MIGVGNGLRGDDAAGLEVVRRLGAGSGVVPQTHEREPRGLLIEHEGEAIDLLERWRGFDAVVVVDTVRSGAAAGTIHRIDASTEPLPSPLRRASSHTIGIGEAIELARTLGGLPARVVVYGVEGERFEAGAGMSEAVAGAIEELARAVAEEARGLACAG